MRQIGDRRLRWRRAPRLAEYVGAATWQQRATLSVAVAGGLACVYLVMYLLGLEIRVPGLDPPASTPAFVAAPSAQRQPDVVHVPAAVLARRTSARRAPEPAKSVTPSRPVVAREAPTVPAAPPPATEAPVPAPAPAPVPVPVPPPADAPAPTPPPQETPAPVQPPLVEPENVVVVPAPALPSLPELGVPNVELPPVPSVALPTLP